MICAFSGHRPWRLPWGSNESGSGCLAVKLMIRQYVEQLAAQGYDHFLCGMALGGDQYFAQAVLDCKRTAPSLILEAVLPHACQEERWSPELQEQYHTILKQCDIVTVVGDQPSTETYLERNRQMVDRCDLLMTLYDGGEGGTAYTVRYAQRMGKQLLPIWL